MHCPKSSPDGRESHGLARLCRSDSTLIGSPGKSFLASANADTEGVHKYAAINQYVLRGINIQGFWFKVCGRCRGCARSVAAQDRAMLSSQLFKRRSRF